MSEDSAGMIESVEDATPADETETKEVDTETASRPEYVPEKYWNAERGETDVEKLSKGYNEIASAFGKKHEDLTAEISSKIQKDSRKDVPKTAEEYVFEPSSEIVPEGTKFNLNKDNPQLKEFGVLAHDIGLSPSQYNQVVNLYVANELAMMPDKKAEVAKLGENSGARIERVDMWSKANLSENAYNAVVGQSISGEFIMAMEELIDKTSGATLDGGDEKHQGALTLEELQTMQKDPRYRDPRHREDGFVKRVEAGFTALAR
tara:strand:- start:122 stop:907 length:786 start_codon:yes stop_codon:yes gene_type:complete